LIRLTYCTVEIKIYFSLYLQRIGCLKPIHSSKVKFFFPSIPTWACTRACGTMWGLRPKVVYWLFVSIIRTSITFASVVWWLGCQTASAKKCKIQRLVWLGIKGAIRTTPTGAMEVLTSLPALDLVVQGEARSAAHRLWSLGCWSYLHPNRGHSSILMRLQKSDPIFNMRIDVMRPGYNFEPKYRVTMFTRDEWSIRPGTPPAGKGRVWYTDGSRTRGKPGPESMDNIREERSVSL